MSAEWKKEIVGAFVTRLSAPDGTRVMITGGDEDSHVARVVRTQLSDEAFEALLEIVECHESGSFGQDGSEGFALARLVLEKAGVR